MKEAVGDIWQYPADRHVITTNGAVRADGACVMGRGVAQQARDKYPGLDMEIGRAIKAYGNHVFGCGIGGILTFPVKHHWRDAADPLLIMRSILEIIQWADESGDKVIVMPRPGCGNGRLHWVDVRHLCKYLDDRFVVIERYG